MACQIAHSKLRSLFIFCFVFTVIFAIITGVLPFIIEKKLLQVNLDKSTPHSDNVEIWGQFPGKLRTHLTHTFTFFDYPNDDILKSNEETVLPLSNKSVIFTEKINFQNFSFDDKVDQISFKSKREYELTSEGPKKIHLPALGLFELFHTLSNPPLYQQGLVATSFLLKMALGNNDSFQKKLLILKYKKFFDEEPDRFKNAVLHPLSEEKRDIVFNHEKYGLSTSDKLFNWINLLNVEGDIKEKAPWLVNELGLSDDEIKKILGPNSYLKQLYNRFIERLIYEFNCDKAKGCELLFTQESDGSILPKFGVQDFAEMNKIFSPNAYQFEAPEMKIFFEKEYKEKGYDFEDFKLDETQLSLLLNEESEYCLTDPRNLIRLLNINTTSSTYEAYELYKISSLEQLNFVSNYIFNYLPKVYIFPEFTHNTQKFQISGTAKAFSSLLTTFIDKIYNAFYPNFKYNAIFISKISYSKLPLDEDPVDICASVFQKIIDDGKRVLQLCSDEYFNFTNFENYKHVLQNYYCFRQNEDERFCDKSLIDELIQKGITKEQQIELYSDDVLGLYFAQALEERKEIYGCTTCDIQELMKIQFLTSKLSLNVNGTDAKSSVTLADWETTEKLEPLEFRAYQENLGFPDDELNCNQNLREAVFTLYNSAFNLFDESYADSLTIKYKFEIMASLYEHKIAESSFCEEFEMENMNNFFIMMRKLYTQVLFKPELISAYKPMSVIKGNNDEDSLFLNLLNSGPYYSNYKPGFEKTTGFDLFIKGENNNNDTQADLNGFTIYSSRADSTQIMRRIIKMNDQPIYSMNKIEYSPKFNQYVSVSAPLYDSARLDLDDWVSDGFQYDFDGRSNLYYFDEISGRTFEFEEGESKSYHSLKCTKYDLNSDNLAQNLREKNDEVENDFPASCQKFNKPFIVTTQGNELTYKTDTVSSDNFLCVDKFSNMVLESELSLVYAIETKGYSLLSDLVEDNQKLPLLLYKRDYFISEDSYKDVFGGVSAFYGWRIAIIVIGVFIIALLLGLGIFFFLKYKKAFEEVDIGEENPRDSNKLLPKDIRISSASSTSEY